MGTRFLVTAAGADRPGIVAGVALALSEGGYDIEDSAMTILRGRFSMMLAVADPMGRPAAALDRTLAPAARDLGMSVHIDPGGEPPAAARPRDAVIVSVSGANRVGIVARVARALADRGVNITDLETRLLSGGAVPVYVMQIEGEADRIDLDALRADLAAAGREVGVDVRVDRLETADL